MGIGFQNAIALEYVHVLTNLCRLGLGTARLVEAIDGQCRLDS